MTAALIATKMAEKGVEDEKGIERQKRNEVERVVAINSIVSPSKDFSFPLEYQLKRIEASRDKSHIFFFLFYFLTLLLFFLLYYSG